MKRQDVSGVIHDSQVEDDLTYKIFHRNASYRMSLHYALFGQVNRKSFSLIDPIASDNNDDNHKAFWKNIEGAECKFSLTLHLHTQNYFRKPFKGIPKIT